jgi:hypothetical protein
MSIRAFNPLRRPRLAVTTICLAAALVGCTDKGTPTWSLPSPFLPRTSPANLLHNLKLAYEKRNLAEYDSLFASDFIFDISAEDQQEPGMPDFWARDTEILIHTRMFDADLVQTLTVDFVPADSVWDPTDSLYTALIMNVTLDFYGGTPSHPTDVKEYRVANGQEKFWFRKNGWTVPGKPDSIWTIVKWEDDQFGGMAVGQRTSWGSVKVLFR